MELDLTSDLITYFLNHALVTSDSGSADTTLRARALGVAQRTVDIYWENPWPFREAEAAIAFGATGIAALPSVFGWWDRNYGYIVWGDPHFVLDAPPEHQVRDVMTARTQYPTRSGRPEAVVIHAGLLKRWPTKPQTAPEAATMFFHRRSPRLADTVTVAVDTISALASDNSFNDSGAGLPVVLPGSIITVSGFDGTAASALANNRQHLVIGTPTTSKIVVATPLVDDAAGADVVLAADEWALIPSQDRLVIVDGMVAAWAVNSGDGREPVHERKFRARVTDLYRERNRDRQPTKWGRPFRIPHPWDLRRAR